MIDTMPEQFRVVMTTSMGRLPLPEMHDDLAEARAALEYRIDYHSGSPFGAPSGHVERFDWESGEWARVDAGDDS